MTIIYHKYNKIVEVERKGKIISSSSNNIAKTLFKTAAEFPNDLIIWCNADLKSNLNVSALESIFHHHKIMASYSLSDTSFIAAGIGYVEASPFIKIDKKGCYPAWQMSSDVGGIHSSVLLKFKNKIKESDSFDYFLNSLAKLGMPSGLLCYSDPALLNNISIKIEKDKQNLFVLFQFVKQHYKTRWIFLLLLNLFLYENKIAFLPFISSLFYSKRLISNDILDSIEVRSTKKILETGTLDVIIPTIGRKKYFLQLI